MKPNPLPEILFNFKKTCGSHVPTAIFFVILLALSPSPSAFSQIPQGFNYQAIARDTFSGNPITDPIDVRIAILADDSPEDVLWEEKHTGVDPDDHGLFSIVVGGGVYESGPVLTFDAIDWSVTPKYIRTQIYFGGEWKNLGSAQLWSVPYAMVAEDTETKQTLSIDGSELTISDGNTITIPSTGSVWQTDGTNIYRETGNVGIKTTSPGAALDVNGEGIFRAAIVPSWIEMNAYSTGDRFSGIDFHGDDTWTDFSLRIYRHNAGEDAYSRIWHRGLGSLQILTNEEAPIDLLTAGSHRLRVAPDGKIGIGTTSPAYPLDVYGEITARGMNSFRLRQSTYSTILRNDNNGFYMLLTNSGDPDGSFNSLRPFSISLGSGNVNIGNGALNVTHGGNIGVGTASTATKMVVQPSSSWSDELPLFEVKNKYGIPVFAVFNNGVKINIEHDPDGVKGPKGGFSIGGYDYTKGGTVTLMNVTPDSIRFNINNDNTKGPKGGFAIGGFDYTKGDINEDFMYITPLQSSAGQYNTFMGYQSGINNTQGTYNTNYGYETGKSNENGWANVFIGHQAGTKNIGSENPITQPFDGNFNVFIGRSAGYNNTRGGGNIYIGQSAGLQNTTGDFNTCIGMGAGALNELGNQNALYGTDAGYKNTSSYNTMLGAKAGYNNVSGVNNVFVGRSAGYYETGSNKLFIDNQSRSNEADARVKALIYGVFDASVSNQLVVINGRLDVPSVIRTTGVAVPSSGAGLELSYSGGVSYVESYDRSASATKPLCLSGSSVYPFTQINLGSSSNRWNTIYCVNAVNVSDSRLKKEISDLQYGLASIMELEPVTFMWNDQTNGDKHIGLIAQDVAEVIREVVDTGDDEEKTLGINYSQLVPVLIKGMQEQQAQIEQLNAVVAAMKEEIASLRPQ